MESRKKIRTFIQRNLIGLEDTSTFSDDADIFEMGFVSSLFAMQLVNFVQEEFDITLANDDISIPNFSSVNNIVGLITLKQNIRS